MLKEAKDRRLYSSVPEQLLSRVSWVIRSSNRRKVAEGELECGRLRLVGDLNPSDDGECVAQWDSGSSALELRREASCITIPSRYLGTLKAAGGGPSTSQPGRQQIAVKPACRCAPHWMNPESPSKKIPVPKLYIAQVWRSTLIAPGLVVYRRSSSCRYKPQHVDIIIAIALQPTLLSLCKY